MNRVNMLGLSNEIAAQLGIAEQEGWNGPFTRAQAKGAAPNGTRVRKTNSQPGDTHGDGAMGTVLGSIRPVPFLPIAYFVEWDDAPRTAVFVVADPGRLELTEAKHE